jgi:hypothetical protein
MAFDPVLIGGTANDGTGDPLRTAFNRVNNNFNLAVEGDASSTPNNVPVFDGVTGKVLRDSGVAISTLTGGLNFAGLWNASTNTPTLTSSVGTEGTYYLVSVAGSTTLNGVSSWAVGDSVLFTGGVWVKLASNFVSNAGASTNNAVAVFDGTTGKLVKQAAFVESDVARLSETQTITGAKTFTGTATVGANANIDRVFRVSSDSNTLYAASSGLNPGASVLAAVENRSNTSGTFAALDFIAGTTFISGVRLSAINVSGSTTSETDFTIAVRDVGLNFVERMRIVANGNVVFGNGNTAASPAAATLRGTNAGGNDTAGPNMTIQAGRGTGTGAGGSLSLQTAAAGTMGSTLNAATTRLFINAAGNVGIGTTSPTVALDVNANTVRVRTARTPASAAATGAVGEICWDADYIYVCTATNTWKRVAIATW